MDMALPNKKKRSEHLSEFFKILHLEATYKILDYLNDHGNCHHKDLKHLTSTFTLSHRLNDLLKYTLIEHHFEKEEKRKEWYTITERGRRALELLKRLEALSERINDERISQGIDLACTTKSERVE